MACQRKTPLRSAFGGRLVAAHLRLRLAHPFRDRIHVEVRFGLLPSILNDVSSTAHASCRFFIPHHDQPPNALGDSRFACPSIQSWPVRRNEYHQLDGSAPPDITRLS
jgi:hypothetical protein